MYEFFSWPTLMSWAVTPRYHKKLRQRLTHVSVYKKLNIVILIKEVNIILLIPHLLTERS